MTEEQLSHLTREEKLKVTRYLIADLAAQLLGEDSSAATKARHDLGALAMTFTELQKVVQSQTRERDAMLQAFYARYRYRTPI